MAWRRLPAPVLLVLTTVLKLKPKSSPPTLWLAALTSVNAWAVPLVPLENTPVEVLNTVPAAPLPPSLAAGLVPPTLSVTATAEPLLALLRQVGTGSRPPT